MTSPRPPRQSLQARMSEADPRLYNVNRDVAHNFKEVMTHVFERLQNRLWPELDALLEKEEVTDAEVGAAFDALCKFIGNAQEEMRVDFKEAMTRSGWFSCKPEAQVAVMAILGTVILGYHWAGVREATLGSEGPALRLQDLVKQGDATAKFLAKPRWRRRFSLLLDRLRRTVGVLFGRD